MRGRIHQHLQNGFAVNVWRIVELIIRPGPNAVPATLQAGAALCYCSVQTGYVSELLHGYHGEEFVSLEIETLMKGKIKTYRECSNTKADDS